jgi:hypothetical protein
MIIAGIILLWLLLGLHIATFMAEGVLKKRVAELEKWRKEHTNTPH